MSFVLKDYPIEVLSAYYQVSGRMQARGEAATFINDPAIVCLEVFEPALTPLAKGAHVGTINPPGVLYVPKEEIQALIIGEFSVADARPLPKKLLLSVFTDTYIIRGNFHMSPEVKAPDLFKVQKGPFFPVTDAELYTLRPLANDIRGEAELLYIRGDAVRVYYEDTTQAP